MQYSIFEGNIDRLEKKLKRVSNKCKKYGSDFNYEVIGEEFKEVEDNGEKYTARFVIVDVSGFAKINNWQFVATIEHKENRNVIRNIIDLDIPERYWTSECYCEHCKTIRRRNDTFLIHNTETNEFKQVGRSCLRDFTGGYDAELVAAYISLRDSLIISEDFDAESCFYGGSFVHYFSVDEAIRMSKSIISKIGFVPSSSETSVPSKVVMYDLDQVLSHGVTKFTKYIEESGILAYYEGYKDDDYIKKVRDYYRNNNEDSNYMKNMKSIMSSDYCQYRDFGYIVSAVSCYDRAMENIRRKKDAEARRIHESEVSQYIGEVKQRITVKVRDFRCISSYSTSFGISCLYKFTDVEGNVLMWSTGSQIDDNRKIETLVGTVRSHEEYRGTKQTWITRCKVTYAPQEKAPEETPDPGVNVFSDALDEMFKYWEDPDDD